MGDRSKPRTHRHGASRGSQVVVTVGIPDERVAGVEHLHRGFPNMATARIWTTQIYNAFGPVSIVYEAISDPWVCPSCRFAVRKP